MINFCKLVSQVIFTSGVIYFLQSCTLAQDVRSSQHSEILNTTEYINYIDTSAYNSLDNVVNGLNCNNQLRSNHKSINHSLSYSIDDESGHPILLVLNQNPEGFVIMSGLKSAPPILA